MVYHPGLAESERLEKNSITGEAASEENNIEANIKARERYPTYMFLSGSDNIRNKQLNTKLEKIHYGVGRLSTRPSWINEATK